MKFKMNLEEPFAAFAGSNSIVLTCSMVTTDRTHVLQRPDVALSHDVTAVRKVLRATSELKIIHFVCIVRGLVVVAVVGVTVEAGKCQKIKFSHRSNLPSSIMQLSSVFSLKEC